MQKILSVDQIRKADLYTIVNEPVSSLDLMERAARQCFKWIHKKKPKGKCIKIFCGTGNNGGDGLVIARMLAEKGYQVEVFVVRFSEKCSDDFSVNLSRLHETESVHVYDISANDIMPEINSDDLVIDAILGSGLTKPVQGLAANVIDNINASGAVVIAIDIPSGMFADYLTDSKSGSIVHADYTLTFQLPKLGFLMAENEAYVGEWEVLPIGLHKDFINAAETNFFFSEPGDIAPLLRSRGRFSHKGTYGHALLIAGSYGKMGAAVLAARAALRSGPGLITVHIPVIGYEIIQTAIPEAMVSLDKQSEVISGLPDLSAFNAIGIGPGIGMDLQTQNSLKLLIQSGSHPLVLDADALNILGENKTWLSFLPAGSILTPHPKEFERLAGKCADSMERISRQREFSVRYNVFVILKGAFTSITTPEGKCFFNPTGNPGMATAGSGDVLTGILLGLLAQGYTPFAASLLGTYIHGLAGDLAASKLGFESLIAGDIIEYLGKAFKTFYR